MGVESSGGSRIQTEGAGECGGDDDLKDMEFFLSSNVKQPNIGHIPLVLSKFAEEKKV